MYIFSKIILISIIGEVVQYSFVFIKNNQGKDQFVDTYIKLFRFLLNILKATFFKYD